MIPYFPSLCWVGTFFVLGAGVVVLACMFYILISVVEEFGLRKMWDSVKYLFVRNEHKEK